MSSQSSQSGSSSQMPSGGQMPPGMDYGELPLSPPPKGVIPNLVDPVSRDYQVYIISGVFTGLMLLFLAMRLYAKLGIQKTRTWDDFIVLAATAGVITYVALTIEELQYGYGKHIWDVRIKEFTNQIQIITVVATALYGVVVFLIKAAILLLFLKLFGRLRWMRLSVYIIITISAIFYGISVIVFFTMCGPSNGLNWLAASQTKRCIHSAYFGVVQGAFNVASDFGLLILPLPAVWSLQLPVAKKLGVSAIFMTGLMACVVSVITLYLRIAELNFFDRTWDVVTLWLMTIVEMNVGLIVACMPAAATVVKAHNPQIVKFWSSLASMIPNISVRVSVRRRGSRGTSGAYLKESKGSSQSSASGASGESGRNGANGGNVVNGNSGSKINRGSGGSRSIPIIVDQPKMEVPKPYAGARPIGARANHRSPESMVYGSWDDVRDEEKGPGSPTIHILS